MKKVMKKSKIDWEEVRINAAISIMQGLMENGRVSTALDMVPKVESELAVRMADALVDELKKPRNSHHGEGTIKKIVRLCESK